MGTFWDENLAGDSTFSGAASVILGQASKGPIAKPKIPWVKVAIGSVVIGGGIVVLASMAGKEQDKVWR
ncbi:MAG: hypothetical protein ACREBG_12420 [Pyrinomonadaceae bacterium]